MSIATRPTCWTSSKPPRYRKPSAAPARPRSIWPTSPAAPWMPFGRPRSTPGTSPPGVLLIREAGGHRHRPRRPAIRPLESPLPGRSRAAITPRNAGGAHRVLPPVTRTICSKIEPSRPFCLHLRFGFIVRLSQTKMAGRTFADLANLVDQQPARGRVRAKSLQNSPRPPFHSALATRITRPAAACSDDSFRDHNSPTLHAVWRLSRFGIGALFAISLLFAQWPGYRVGRGSLHRNRQHRPPQMLGDLQTYRKVPIQYVGPDTYILLDAQGRPQPVPGMTYEDFLAAWKKLNNPANAGQPTSLHNRKHQDRWPNSRPARRTETRRNDSSSCRRHRQRPTRSRRRDPSRRPALQQIRRRRRKHATDNRAAIKRKADRRISRFRSAAWRLRRPYCWYRRRTPNDCRST